MRKLIVKLEDVTGQVDSRITMVVRAPYVRAGEANTDTIHGHVRPVELTGGAGSINVEPGPLEVIISGPERDWVVPVVVPPGTGDVQLRDLVLASDVGSGSATAAAEIVENILKKVAQGPKGDKGDRGEKGDRGDTGLKGDTGERGLRGEKGDRGDSGPGLAIVGTVAAKANLPTGLKAGDAGKAYVTSNDQHLWAWSGTGWVDTGTVAKYKEDLAAAIADAVKALAPTGLKLVLAAKDDAAAQAADTAIAGKGYGAVVVVPATGNWYGTL